MLKARFGGVAEMCTGFNPADGQLWASALEAVQRHERPLRAPFQPFPIAKPELSRWANAVIRPQMTIADFRAGPAQPPDLAGEPEGAHHFGKRSPKARCSELGRFKGEPG